MNKSILYVLLAIAAVAILAFIFRSFNTSKTDDNNLTNNDNSQTELLITEIDGDKNDELVNGEYFTDVEASMFNWEGRKTLIVGYKDQGTINVQSGFMLVEEGALMSGEIILDMTSLTVDSVGQGGVAGLERHLKSADFFDVENFAEARVTLMSVVPVAENNENGTKYNLEAEITIKDISNNVIIPAEVYMQDSNLVVFGQVDLDRTLWDIRYGSDKFFDNLANNVIDDFFTVGFRFVSAQK